METPTGRQYVGVDFAKKLCGVSIIRSGESMENALRACCKGIKIGKILVHRWALRCKPPLHFHFSNNRACACYSSKPVTAVSMIQRGAGQYRSVAGGGSRAIHLLRPLRSRCDTFSFCAPLVHEQTPYCHDIRVGDAAVDQALVYEKLPQDIADRHVLLLDPMLGCGSSAVKAIEVRPVQLVTLLCSHRGRGCVLKKIQEGFDPWSCIPPAADMMKSMMRQVLLEKGVEEGKILFLTLIAAPEGLTNICRRYPKVSKPS